MKILSLLTSHSQISKSLDRWYLVSESHGLNWRTSELILFITSSEQINIVMFKLLIKKTFGGHICDIAVFNDVFLILSYSISVHLSWSLLFAKVRSVLLVHPHEPYYHIQFQKNGCNFLNARLTGFLMSEFGNEKNI